MPTYQYACTSCDHELEVRQSFSDEPLTECPRCEGPLRKVFNAVGVVFKGSGFYKTDSRSEATKSSVNGSSKSESTGSTDTSGGGSAAGGSGNGSGNGSSKGSAAATASAAAGSSAA